MQVEKDEAKQYFKTSGQKESRVRVWWVSALVWFCHNFQAEFFVYEKQICLYRSLRGYLNTIEIINKIHNTYPMEEFL